MIRAFDIVDDKGKELGAVEWNNKKIKQSDFIDQIKKKYGNKSKIKFKYFKAD